MKIIFQMGHIRVKGFLIQDRHFSVVRKMDRICGPMHDFYSPRFR